MDEPIEVVPAPPFFGWMPWTYQGNPYYMIVWDWKDEVPVDQISEAAKRGHIHMRTANVWQTDNKAIIASKIEEFDPDTIWNDYDEHGGDDPTEWTPGDPIPEGFKVYDGDAESGPCMPHLVPIEVQMCDTCHTEQLVVQTMTVNPADPTAAHALACGHINI